MSRKCAFVLVLCAGWLSAGSTTLAQPAASPSPAAISNPPSTDPAVSLKETPPVRIAFVQHQGPYWTLGPVFDLVREAMAKQNEDGPMFVRYHGDPRKVSAAALKSDVGFVLDGAGDSSSPLTMDRRPAEKVAYVLAPSPHGTTSRFYALLYDWAKQNGYEATGGPVEVYWGRNEKDVVEIQLPIAEVAQVAQARHEIPQQAKTDQPVRGMENPQRAQDVPPIERMPIPSEAQADQPTQRDDVPLEIRPEQQSEEPAAQARPEPTAFEASALRPQQAKKEDQKEEVPARQPASLIQPQTESQEYVPRESQTAQQPETPALHTTEIETKSEKQTVRPEPPESLPNLEESPLVAAAIARADITLRFAERNFNGLANTLLPEGTRLDPEMQVWIGQMAYRLLAVGRGMRQKFGEDADDVQYAAAALLERWRTFLPPSADPLALATRSSSKIADPHQKDVLRRADLLLGRIALEASDKEAATLEVVEMLQEIMEILRSHP